MILLAVELAAAVALLLWSIRLIRTGVERAFLPELRRGLKALGRNRLTAAASGTAAAMILQSATAVALMAGGFAATGMLAPQAALALVLGADLGSALMAQVLMLPVQAVGPFAMLGGVLTFLNARTRKAKQIGRIVIGFALVLYALQMMRTATAPIGSAEIVQAASAYLADDLVSAFAIGAVMAWAMHSSLAAALTFATFAATGVVGIPLGAALVIGANLGGGVIPVVILSAAPPAARRVAVGNLLARGTVTVLFLVALLAVPGPIPTVSDNPAQTLVGLHVILNGCAVLLSLPLVTPLAALADRMVPDRPDARPDVVSSLDEDALDRPRLALGCAQRELMQMGQSVQSMLIPVTGLFRRWDDATARSIALREEDVDRMHYRTKLYVSALRARDLTADQDRRAVGIVAMANSLEEAADRIAESLMSLARRMHDEALAFSEEGFADIDRFHDQVVTNSQLALDVLTTGDAEAARQLVAEKDRIRREEQVLQERHLRRLGEGVAASVTTTNIHQETLRLLKQINAALTYVAYPIAEETGDLLGSRLARPARPDDAL